jgi:hypothetical protein
MAQISTTLKRKPVAAVRLPPKPITAPLPVQPTAKIDTPPSPALQQINRSNGSQRQIGHNAVCVQNVRDWIFRHCCCGFTLALTPDDQIWWLRANSPAHRLDSFTELLQALATDCRYFKRPNPRTNDCAKERA